MNRLGFRLEEFGAAYERLRRNAHVHADPTLVTHLASADDRRDPKTRQQLDAFAAATAGLAGRAQHCEQRRRARLADGARRLGAPRPDALRRLAVSERHGRGTRSAACDDAAHAK